VQESQREVGRGGKGDRKALYLSYKHFSWAVKKQMSKKTLKKFRGQKCGL
jgi:hypothetical protein